MKVAALTRVGNYGWEGYGFEICGSLPDPCPVSLTLYTEDGEIPWSYQNLYQNKDTIRVIYPKFSYFSDYILTVDGNLISKEKVDEVRTLWADLFEDCRTSEFWYRLYSPKAKEPRPLILFLHGGGECGTDNWKQLVNTVGAARLAERYPDVYVMAPQTPVDLRKQVEEADGPRAYATAQMYGWTKGFLQPVCEEIRRLIAEGKVDESRVYITGSGRGGGGCFLAMEMEPDLFAAAAPVSPRITPEVTRAMLSAAHRPVWISVPYVDERPERNKYIFEAIMAMKDAGGKNVHLTIYGAEELAAYGIGADKNLSFEERIKENHWAWILTYNNEAGILDWLLEQHR